MPQPDESPRRRFALSILGVTLTAILGFSSPCEAQATARVELPNGVVAEWPLPSGAQITAVSFDDSDPLVWVAAGTRPLSSGSTREAFVVIGRGASIQKTLRARERGQASISEPTALFSAGKLRGLAWFRHTANGDARSASLVVAPFSGRRFGRPQVIAAKGPGSQLALAVTPLGRDAFVLAWSAFDGQDDEIVWSRGTPGGTWSQARPATENQVPDITPALATTDAGVILSWARFEAGNYRVAVSRFEGERFAAGVSVGASGSVFPGFVPNGSGRKEEAFVLYRTARPRGWEIAELDREGAVVRRAALSGDAGARSDRPSITLAPSGATFRWPLGSAFGDDGGDQRSADERDSTFAPWQEEPR